MAGISFKAAGGIENKNKYNGKELQHSEFSDGSGLEENDFGARMLDPQLGVWHNVDPLADKMRRFSPYAFVFDSPLRFLDPDGMEGNDWIKKGRKLIFDKNIHSQKAAVAYYGKGAKDLGATVSLYNRKLDADVAGDENGNIGPKKMPVIAIKNKIAFINYDKSVSGMFIGEDSGPGLGGRTTNFKVTGNYVDGDNKTQTLKVSAFAQSSGSADGGEPNYFGQIDLKQNGKIVQSNSIYNSQNDQEIDEAGTHRVGSTTFNLQKGQNYELHVKLNYVLASEDGGVNPAAFTASDQVIEVPVPAK